MRKVDDDYFAGKRGFKEAYAHAQAVLEKGKNDESF